MNNIDTSNWKEFKLCELFDITTTKAIDRKNIQFDENGKYDFIGRTPTNYGLQGKINKLEYAPNPANTFSVVQIGETCCLFRENEWYASQNIFLMKPKFQELIETKLFITTMINKEFEIYKEAYSYPTLKILKDLSIKLPVKEIEEIDWDYMEKYIRAMEKVVIADVVKYKDQVIETTKRIVEK